MAGLEVHRYLKHSDGTELNGYSMTASFESEDLDIGEFDEFGLTVLAADESGTSPTIDVSIEWSPDNGTTNMANYPAALNSQTQAAMTQITTDGNACKFWPVFSVVKKNGALATKIVVQFTLGGTSTPSYTLTCWLTCRKRTSTHDN
jgi:hypothetical protein